MGLEPHVYFGRKRNDNEWTEDRYQNDHENQNDLVNGTLAKVSNSGNSDVDVNTNVKFYMDLMPIAYAILYSSLASKKLSKKEFEYAIRKLENYKSNKNSTSKK